MLRLPPAEYSFRLNFKQFIPAVAATLTTRWSRRSECPRPDGNMTHEATCNAAFRRHHVCRLLHRMGTLLPLWLNGPDLVRECRGLEQLCWRELGYPQQPVFDSDLPPFFDGGCRWLLPQSVDANGPGRTGCPDGCIGTIATVGIFNRWHESQCAGSAAELHTLRVPVAAVVVLHPTLGPCDLASHPNA